MLWETLDLYSNHACDYYSNGECFEIIHGLESAVLLLLVMVEIYDVSKPDIPRRNVV